MKHINKILLINIIKFLLSFTLCYITLVLFEIYNNTLRLFGNGDYDAAAASLGITAFVGIFLQAITSKIFKKHYALFIGFSLSTFWFINNFYYVIIYYSYTKSRSDISTAILFCILVNGTLLIVFYLIRKKFIKHKIYINSTLYISDMLKRSIYTDSRLKDFFLSQLDNNDLFEKLILICEDQEEFSLEIRTMAASYIPQFTLELLKMKSENIIKLKNQEQENHDKSNKEYLDYLERALKRLERRTN